MILPTLIQGDDVVAQTILFGGFLLDLGHRLPALDRSGGVILLRAHVTVDAIRHVLDGQQDIELQVGGLRFLGISASEEPVAVVVLRVGRQLGERVGAHVVVGHDKAVSRDEGAGAAVIESYG